MSEQARLGLAPDAANRFTWQLRYIERRVNEAARLSEMGETPPDSLQNHLSLQLEQALQLAAGMEDPQAMKALARLRETLVNQERILAGAGNGNPAVQGALRQIRQQIRARLQQCEDGMQTRTICASSYACAKARPGWVLAPLLRIPAAPPVRLIPMHRERDQATVLDLMLQAPQVLATVFRAPARRTSTSTNTRSPARMGAKLRK